ncbi:hypothetical protein MPS_0358 [Mycobacterium pseudoshottsii JCM 15466]|nr:hypothetical protein MPS_0358 [Mycobacterium pseudoshottsii JCM 15466]
MAMYKRADRTRTLLMICSFGRWSSVPAMASDPQRRCA